MTSSKLEDQLGLSMSPEHDASNLANQKHCQEKENLVLLKDTLVSPDDNIFDHLRILLQEKICDGNGECIFEVGFGAAMMRLEGLVKRTINIEKAHGFFYEEVPSQVTPPITITPVISTPASPDSVGYRSVASKPISMLKRHCSSPTKSPKKQKKNDEDPVKIAYEDEETEKFARLFGDDSISGLECAEYEASVATLKTLAETLDADCVLLREKKCGKDGLQGQYLLRKRADMLDFMEVRVAVVGNVDAGKSTLLGVLTHGELDNGRGFARMKLFRHKHEMETGRTSSVGNDILGFDSKGRVVNKPDHGHLDWVKICEDSSKVITFIDLAGHERYLKTTVFGMTGHLPDFTMLMVGANAGIVGMTKEHLGLALALNVPVFVVVTKIDMCPPNVLQDTLKLLHKILKSAGCRKVPLLVRNNDDVVVSATNFVSERLCPIFQVSNVTGLNLELLSMFLNLLSSRTVQNDKEPAQFQIDDTYQVPGVGVVVSGTCIKGVIHVNDTLLLGPNGLGDFIMMPIKSIHRKRMPVREVRGGQTASFALKKIKINEVRKGQVLVDPSLNPTSCWEFKGEILVLHHPTTISTKYQAMVHVGSVRQTASIIAMDKECLRTGDKAVVHFRFIKHPEYLKSGLKMVFREGRTKAVGRVLDVIPKAASLQQIKNSKILKMVKQSLSNQPTITNDSQPSGSEGSSATGLGVGLSGGALQKKQRSRRGGKHRSRGSNVLPAGMSFPSSTTSAPTPAATPSSPVHAVIKENLAQVQKVPV